MNFLSYLSSKKKIRILLSFLVAIVSFMLCSHQLHGIIIYNGTNKKITILSLVEMPGEGMRSSGSGRFQFNINKKNKTISPNKFIDIENTVFNNYFTNGQRKAKFSCLLLNVKQDDKKYVFNTKMIPESTRDKLRSNYVVLSLQKPKSKESRDSKYLCKNGDKWNQLNIRFALSKQKMKQKDKYL